MKKTRPKTRRKRRGGNYYFTKVHEDAIVEYARTKDVKVRTELYIKYIGPVFDEMVDKIIYTYRFTGLPNIDYLKNLNQVSEFELETYAKNRIFLMYAYDKIKVGKNENIQCNKLSNKFNLNILVIR